MESIKPSVLSNTSVLTAFWGSHFVTADAGRTAGGQVKPRGSGAAKPSQSDHLLYEQSLK